MIAKKDALPVEEIYKFEYDKYNGRCVFSLDNTYMTEPKMVSEQTVLDEGKCETTCNSK